MKMSDTACEQLSDTAHELALYIENDFGIYNGFTMPMVRNLAKHMRKGNFTRDEALKSTLRLATAGAQNYNREHGSMFGPKWSVLFPMADRKQCAEYLLDRYMDHVRELAEA
jgi:hypothetical protein